MRVCRHMGIPTWSGILATIWSPCRHLAGDSECVTLVDTEAVPTQLSGALSAPTHHGKEGSSNITCGCWITVTPHILPMHSNIIASP